MHTVYLNVCVETVFNSREKALCVLECARTNPNKTVQHAFVRKFSKKPTTAKQICSRQKSSETKAICAEQKDLETTNIGRESRPGSPNTLAKTQNIRKKNNSGNRDSSNCNLAGSKETLDNETLQTAARSSHNGRYQTKAQTCKKILKKGVL